MIHRTGKRALHKSRKYSVAIEAIEMEENDEAAEIKTNDDDHATVSNFMHDMCDFSIIIDFYFYALGEKKKTKADVKLPPQKKEINVGEIMEARAKFIPLRLKMEERKYLRM